MPLLHFAEINWTLSIVATIILSVVLTRVLQFSGAINRPSDDSGHAAPPPSLVAFPRLFFARSAAISC